ncbi:DUF6153 family protein [Lentzea nigeriaca]|uniref:DUF6153 family protein n=1 Tax=Lentzea nigeriaca TaxID=1128665 RepID=UPI00195CF6D1|nr:DUF6153 family protein [Lentzea nigeriaca]MBM7860697.1 hypothetical protein [Lentzea nigeriaca]
MTGTSRTVAQWLLLCVLFLGVVGMHHVATSGDMASGHDMAPVTAQHEQTPEEPTPSSPAHDMLHLCVAVLCAIVSLLLLAWLLVRSTPENAGHTRGSSAWPRAPGHPPPLGGRALLSSINVLRL